MGSLIDSTHGTVVLLASILVVLCLHLLARVGEFVFGIFNKKTETSDKTITEISLALQANTNAVRELRIQLGILERELNEIHKFKVDSKKLFSAIKIMAGTSWPRLRKKIEEDDIPK